MTLKSLAKLSDSRTLSGDAKATRDLKLAQALPQVGEHITILNGTYEITKLIQGG